jgi:acetolactate synthase-1/2/3 large subunit
MTSPTTPRTILGTDYILEALAAEGLGHLFMVPGGLVDPFLPALARQRKLTPVVAAHEGGAVYMADGYARASGSFGAALGIGGPGCCNMATAVAAAKTDGSPVLVMTGEVPLDLEDRGTFQDASQATLDDTAVMAPLTRLSKTVASAKNLNHWFRHALTAMWAQPRGPVHLSLTHDALAGECAADYVAVSGFFAHAWRLSMEAAETALRLLAGPFRSRARCAPKACSRRTMRCRSASSAMPAAGMPPPPSSTATSTAFWCSAPASTSATPCTGPCANGPRLS